MSSFANAMNAHARTSNNAVSYNSPDVSGVHTGRISLFFKGVRGLNVPRLYQYLSKSVQESLIDTFLLVFNLRDCRGGKGERELGRRALVWLFVHYPVEFGNVLHLLPEYGRWDDLLEFFPGVINVSNLLNEYRGSNFDEKHIEEIIKLQHRAVKIMADQLLADQKSMFEGKPCSICAKWSPTEGDNLDKQHNVFSTLAKVMRVKKKVLRTKFNTPLRRYINVIEQYMCGNEWDKIDYSKVPGQAMRRLKNVFLRHDSERFSEWTRKLQRGEVKVNANTVFPHELVREIRVNNKASTVTEAQWNVLIEQVRKYGSLKDCVAVVDTSSSMQCPDYIPLDVAVSMGLIISDVVTGPFHGHLLTFNYEPAFEVIPDGKLYTRWLKVKQMKWGGSTNIQATFDLILNRGLECKLTDADMPKRLFIISDMQFNQVEMTGGHRTNMEEINRKYKESGFTRPQIVFWNVNGESTDFPVTVRQNGTVLISGFSPSVLKAILNGKCFNSIDIMRSAIDDKRYDNIRTALGIAHPNRDIDEDFEIL